MIHYSYCRTSTDFSQHLSRKQKKVAWWKHPVENSELCPRHQGTWVWDGSYFWHFHRLTATSGVILDSTSDPSYLCSNPWAYRARCIVIVLKKNKKRGRVWSPEGRFHGFCCGWNTRKCFVSRPLCYRWVCRMLLSHPASSMPRKFAHTFFAYFFSISVRMLPVAIFRLHTSICVKAYINLALCKKLKNKDSYLPQCSTIRWLYHRQRIT